MGTQRATIESGWCGRSLGPRLNARIHATLPGKKTTQPDSQLPQGSLARYVPRLQTALEFVPDVSITSVQRRESILVFAFGRSAFLEEKPGDIDVRFLDGQHERR